MTTDQHQEILRTEGLSKFFPGVKALDNVDFSLRRGEIMALLGENGAGKSTGIGMNEIMLSRIFRPFERLASETNTDGFGLGLPITKGLVDLLGGTCLCYAPA